jgi:hypothetical protein
MRFSAVAASAARFLSAGRMLAIAAGLALTLVAVCRADDAIPAPPATDDPERVYVGPGVTDRFEKTREAIARARRTSGRTYRVIVVGRGGDGVDARTLLDRLHAAWSQAAEQDERDQTDAIGFEPADDVTILLDEGDRLLAMRVPSGLEIANSLDAATIETELIGKAFVPRARDGLYDQGLADLIDGTESWIVAVDQDEAARIEAATRFRTRTLPLGLAAVTGTGLLAGLLLQRGRHARRLGVAREKLAAFKGEVVALSDMLDAQQERHRMLPHSDPDFATPMEGMTRSAYDDVQAAIRRHRERWLALMDVWERADERIKGEWFLGTGAADEAIRLLDSAAARPPLEEVAGQCRGPLDALEQAHERAREAAGELTAGLETLNGRLDGLGRRGRSAAPYQAAVAELSRARELASLDVERDPVAARGRLEAAADGLDALTKKLDAVEQIDDRNRRAEAQTVEIAGRVRALRAEGWLLVEPGADPDDRIGAARQACGLAENLLDAGEAELALTHVAKAEQANAEAVALLESIAAARARIEDLLPACAARLERLAAGRAAVVGEIEHLAASYAESSWADVADNVTRADDGLARVRTLIDEARAAAEAGRQHYFRALALLEEAVRQEDWIESCLGAIRERRSELDELRATLPGRRDQVGGRIAALGRRLEMQRTDRVRANERCREAARIIEVADGGLAASRPDLRQARQLVQAADDVAARAEQLADEDERLAGQAAHDLEETDALVRRVAAWYSEGVQPDVRAAEAALETARSLLGRMQYEDSIRHAAEASLSARAAYADAGAEAERRRRRRLEEVRRRQMEDAFGRMTRGAGPWVIQLPGGTFTGPDPWRTTAVSMPTPRQPQSAGAGWSRDIAQVGW